jgi:putative MATE family efflux protein
MRLSFRDDPEFLPALLRVAGPVAAQQLVMALLNAVDILMIGQLGETAVAAVTLANQFHFLLIIVLFGVGTGAAVFAAQFWGARDIERIRSVLGMALMLSVGAGFIFTLIAVLAPEWVIGIYSADPEVIALGGRYLRISGLTFVPSAITLVYSFMLRGTGQARLPMAVSIVAVSLKTGLGYLLIFGHMGFPALGAEGMAVASSTARVIETIALVALIYAGGGVMAATARELAGFLRERWLIGRFAHVASPVILGEFGWALAGNTYQLIYARIGTTSIAAVNIAATIENIAFVPFIGITAGVAALIGAQIGAGHERQAERSAHKALWLTFVGASAVGVAILAASGWLPRLYEISPETAFNARWILAAMSVGVVLKSTNLVMFAGIMRAGGDTRFAAIADVGAAWLVGIPLAALGAFVLGLPAYQVYVLALTEEVVKLFVCLRRVRSGRWVHNVVRRPATGET